MAIYQDTYYAQVFALSVSGVPVNISGWSVEMMLKTSFADVTPLLTLTTANGGLVIVDGPNGRLQVTLTQAQTSALSLGRVRFDAIRTDNGVPGPTYLFGGSFKVLQPVTRV